MHSSMVDLVVLFIFLETASVLSEQQKTAVHQNRILTCMSHTDELFMSNKLLYYAKFCVDSKFDVRTCVAIHNQEISKLKKPVLNVFARFCKILAVQQVDENQN